MHARAVPTDSVIFGADYPNPKDLADYLKKLDDVGACLPALSLEGVDVERRTPPCWPSTRRGGTSWTSAQRRSAE
jgi:hypothetical protein